MKSISTSTLLLLLLATLANLPSSIHAISFTASTAGCDGDPFSDLDLIVTCNNSTRCGFGNTAIISGTVEATSAFSDSAVTLQACIMGYCPSDYARNAGNLCNWLTATEDQECGEVGMYEIAAEQEIPEADLLAGYSWLVTVNIGVEEECEAGGETSYQMTYSMAGLVSLVMGAAAFAAKKRRCGDVDDDDDDERGTRFVEMGDVAVV